MKGKEKMILLLPRKGYGNSNDITEIKNHYNKILEEDGRFYLVLTICDSEFEVEKIVRLKDWIDSKVLLLEEINNKTKTKIRL